MEKSEGDRTEQGKISNINLSETQEDELWKVLKRGVYKELYRKELISDTQLNELLSGNMQV